MCILSEFVFQISPSGFVQAQEVPVEGIKNISVGDFDASRHLIDDFLNSHTAYKMLPDSGKVI
jgi:hypothetical protein